MLSSSSLTHKAPPMDLLTKRPCAAPQSAGGEVAREAIAGGDAREPVGQHEELGGKRRVHDEAPAGDGNFLERRALAGEALVDAVEVRLGALVDEHAAEHVDEAIAGG